MALWWTLWWVSGERYGERFGSVRFSERFGERFGGGATVSALVTSFVERLNRQAFAQAGIFRTQPCFDLGFVCAGGCMSGSGGWCMCCSPAQWLIITYACLDIQ